MEIIAHCGWRYSRFPLGFREAGELLPERGVLVFHETARPWCAKFGQVYAHGHRLQTSRSISSFRMRLPFPRACARRRSSSPRSVSRNRPVPEATGPAAPAGTRSGAGEPVR
ncbi:hypothetical protein [Streptomyces viridosporus]|uniref:hypothetical protein n=1 Tax=Streptomyces viridosporus TaxID=67581 RepID=UPI0036F795CE